MIINNSDDKVNQLRISKCVFLDVYQLTSKKFGLKFPECRFVSASSSFSASVIVFADICTFLVLKQGTALF
jgi:hypothetical protein